MKIFLDACAIIYWVEMMDPQFSKFSTTLLRIKKQHKNTTFAASHLSLLECRIKPLRENQNEILERYRDFFCASDLSLIEMSAEVIERATNLRAFNALRTPDAIQAASALSISDEVIFVTGDRSFKKISQLNVLLI